MLYLREPEPDCEITEAPMSLIIPTWILIIASIYFGLDTELTLSAANASAEALLGPLTNSAGQ